MNRREEGLRRLSADLQRSQLAVEPPLVPCHGCGQLKGVPEYDEALWDAHSRLPGGKQFIEPLVYTSQDIDEAGGFQEDGSDGIMLSMERNMAERGLCTECGRPDMRGVDPDTLLSEEDAEDLAAMHAEMEAERRLGA